MEYDPRENQHKYLLNVQLIQMINTIVLGNMLVLLPLVYATNFPAGRLQTLIPFLTAGAIYAVAYLSECFGSFNKKSFAILAIMTFLHWAFFGYFYFRSL